MSKYIKLEAAINKLDEWFCEPYTPTELLSDLPTIEVGEDCISVEDIGKTLNEWLADKEMAKFATKVLRLNAPRVIPTTEQSSKVGIVRCQDCKYAVDLMSEIAVYQCENTHCNGFRHYNDFCSFGEGIEE